MKIKAKATPDVLVRNEGTVFLFCPLTPQAKEWIDENVQSDAQWFGNALWLSIAMLGDWPRA